MENMCALAESMGTSTQFGHYFMSIEYSHTKPIRFTRNEKRSEVGLKIFH